jgi:hypothetical protein
VAEYQLQKGRYTMPGIAALKRRESPISGYLYISDFQVSQLCFGYAKTCWPHSCYRIHGGFFEDFLMLKERAIKMIDNTEDNISKGRVNINKGGRPRKQHRRRQIMAAMCTPLEKKLIEINAQRAGLTVSEFLRDMGLKNKVQVKIKSLPKNVLELKGTLNHTAANINQLARKRNSGDELNALERALLNQYVREIQNLVTTINIYLK